MVPIAGNWMATCKSDTSSLSSAVQTWVSQAAQWTTLNKYLIVNIANEWAVEQHGLARFLYQRNCSASRGWLYRADPGRFRRVRTDEADLVQYSQAVFESDPERNVMFALHQYGNTNDYSASIQSISKGNPTVITLTSTSATHPFAPTFNGSNNSWCGARAYQISGVQGMTQANGEQPTLSNVGGSPGAWTVTLTVDSTNWGSYTGGGRWWTITAITL